jgi:hypothetical protein
MPKREKSLRTCEEDTPAASARLPEKTFTKPNAFKRFKAFLYREIRIIHFLFSAMLSFSGYFMSFIS